MNLAVIIPVKDRREMLSKCLAALVVAQARHGRSKIVVVDNGSTDGSRDIALTYATRVSLTSSDAIRIGAVRNAGARTVPDADALVFLDSDCVVREDFLEAVERAFETSNADAVGCEVLSPRNEHWTERVSDDLHRPQGDGFRNYINSACFCVRTDWFWKIQGFDEHLVSSEDVDVCRRLSAAGGTMWQSESLAVLHLGNPKTVRGVYRRLRWHGEGVIHEGHIQWSVTALATVTHAVFVVLGIAAGGWMLWHGHLIGIGLILVGLLLIPALFVIARMIQYRRAVPILGGIALMSISFPARLEGLIRALVRTLGWRVD